MTRSERAYNYFLDGNNCAQSVIVSFADVLKIDEEVALRMAAGFGGGMGSMQNTCGAVSGAFMVIGFLRGKYKEGDDEAKEVTNTLIQEFSKKFTARFGSINCLALIDADFSTEEGKQKAKREDVFNRKCSNYVRESVELLEEILKK
jgi:C_GCAxxG_C_C family probable redox protein